jgi:hypothetical protein
MRTTEDELLEDVAHWKARADAACQGLEKIATGSTGGRDNWETAQVMRTIARETLVAVGYGE